jgi:divinyl chlorophyllide a 8-vinyl-reductase
LDEALLTPDGAAATATTSKGAGEGRRRRVCLLGATGTIGRATLSALVLGGYEVVCLVRSEVAVEAIFPGAAATFNPPVLRRIHAFDAANLDRDAFAGDRFDAVISCMASRTGAPEDAWAVDYQAHLNTLAAAQRAGVAHFILLSAICVQKPRLEFQKAKLAFEEALIASGLRYCIVRPTAFFKSLSGQIERVRSGRPFLIFGDGRLTACKPISDDDLADYLVGCLEAEDRWDCVLPIGGPGEAISPRQQGEALFALLDRPPRFRSAPIAVLDVVIAALALFGRLVPSLAAKAELARIGRYYATESMLVWDPRTARYDADATPSTGSQTLFEFYRQILAGAEAPNRGEHAVF